MKMNLDAKELVAQTADHLIVAAERAGAENRMEVAFILQDGSSEQIAAWLEKVFLERDDLCEAFLNVSPEDRTDLFTSIIRNLREKVSRYE